ncbi:BlaI/MecI/CopY family transcriptional regulator [Nonlabens ponticola]|uniref:BlaI/MecI/CopY family transcriptional regulator n=1 Tax=Nonlabens ponticola TaxID=2496866 RepID=A0A3S9MY11_9FLAO|nr:BlaI/MecI/CopY family transcriptional regulator [Nonlabens ponticola]AZQ43933.1 BlaI/MecI/CopY family transcriptional regulator [Nonlabens ponticola]
MEKLTKKEEEVMQVLWDLEKAFVKEMVPHLDAGNHYNTVSTIVRKLVDKGFVGYEAFGKTHRYFPLVEKTAYRNTFVSNAMSNYFNNSYKNMVSFFAKEEKISAGELREILEMIESKEK